MRSSIFIRASFFFVCLGSDMNGVPKGKVALRTSSSSCGGARTQRYIDTSSVQDRLGLIGLVASAHQIDTQSVEVQSYERV